ncbi:HAD-IIA family hydrolase [Haladaptatus sp. YSMS36]|uniref:HAD-IIA family hydrolase n=1 Tax=Haladaptatus sp. YSMS36 TaxID=3033384 RepID=UPI0023E84084|nr:HAD-IIA family hydrolase [Haladaptatus sp. YSMS36]
MTYRGAVVDLDGTVYRGESLIPGANAGIDFLRSSGLDLLFFSNNPTKSPAAYSERLASHGLDVPIEEIASSATVTAAYLQDHHADDNVFVIGDPGLVEQLEAADLTLTDEPTATDVLVGSWDREFSYRKLTSALWAIQAGAAFIGTDPDRRVPIGDGRLIPGSGAIIHAIEGVADRPADHVLGKPSEEAAELALSRLGVSADECLVIGDSLQTDISMGERVGMTTVLVRSGITTPENIDAGRVRPDYVVDSLGEIGEIF